MDKQIIAEIMNYFKTPGMHSEYFLSFYKSEYPEEYQQGKQEYLKGLN